jgi:imidazolonepropionase-like amidohydrolase
MQTISLRKAIARGLLVGPRIITSGKTLATTGGHGDPTNGRSKNDYAPPSPEDGVIDSYDDAKKAVRQRYKDGVDGIKITATGGVLSVAKSGQNPQFMQDELAGIIETAQDYGLWVAAHAHGTEGIIRAVEAGVNSIEHGTYLDEAGMDLMIAKETYYVPTIMAGEWVAKKAKIDNFFPELVRPKAAAIGPQIQSTFAKAYKRGVKIAFGTDSGVSPHGDNWQEFVLMVEAGMPAAEAIQSATIETAKLFRLDDVLGQIKINYLADIVATNEDPTKNISALGNIAFVMKDGEPFMSFGLMGGAMQPQGHVQVLVNIIDFGMDVQTAGDAARFNHDGGRQPTGVDEDLLGTLLVEPGVPAETVTRLREMGHRVEVDASGAPFGGYQAIMRLPDGVYVGATEMRKDGTVVAW